MEPHHGTDEQLSLTAAAAEIGVSQPTLKKWVQDGLIPAIQLPSGRYRVYRSDLRKFWKNRGGRGSED